MLSTWPPGCLDHNPRWKQKETTAGQCSLLTRMQKPPITGITCKQSTEHSLCNGVDKIRTKLHRVNHETTANPSWELQRRMKQSRKTRHRPRGRRQPASPDVLCSTDISLSKKVFLRLFRRESVTSPKCHQDVNTTKVGLPGHWWPQKD